MNNLLLKNCIIEDYEENNFERKDVLISHGKISKIEETIDDYPSDSSLIDLEEKYLFPGIIDCHTHVGIIEECTGKIGVDNNETSIPIT